MDCEHLAERMVDVVQGRASWTALEAAHVRDCPLCSAEWRLIAGAFNAGSDIEIDVDRVADAVMARLAADRRPIPIVRRLRWVVGFAAAAALTFAVLRTEPESPPLVPAEPTTVLSELDGLSADELEVVLDALDPVLGEAPPDADAARLGDLTTSELERVLRSLEG